ncbi:mediator of RNA polymerase II transcription subunit 33B isoform X2 [Ricinus communis]|uniref:mediator of RNA polymerase II transcription subunit 33B isoform X2 n=1 Tax=Ricinus communis TaxID=3988 RepID=UPI00201AB3A8|nr:mediator of RNA polymerase II transcription subunit 33B isoform X2 [Ricinus communis]
MAVLLQPGQPSLWDSVLQLTKSAQEKNSDPLLWAIQLSSTLNSAGIVLPSTDLAHLLVSHICFANHVPITWKFLEKALSLKLAPPVLVLALLSTRVLPNRKLHPTAYRLYVELAKRHGFSFASQINGPDYPKTMKLLDDVLHLSHIFDLQVCEPGLLLVAFVFSIVWQLLDASLDDEGLLDLTSEKNSRWLISPQDMEIDGHENFGEKRSEHHKGLLKVNTTMAIDLIGEFLQNKVTSRFLYLARQNMPSYWRGFIHRIQLLAANSAALRNSKHINPEILLQLTSDTRRLLSQDRKKISLEDFHSVMSSGSLISSAGQCHGASWSVLWLPIDLFLEHAMDGSQVTAISAVDNLTGLVKALQAVNATTWHDTFLGLWIAALRLVQREREPSEGPVPRIDTCLSMLLSITTVAVANIIEEEEGELLDETERGPINQIKEKQGLGKCHKGLITALQLLGDYDSLLTPPQLVSSVANQAAAKAMLFISGISSGNGYYESLSMNEMPINCSYFWPGYVTAHSTQMSHGVLSQVPGWSALMKGSPLTPSMISTLVATPASSLPEIEKVYEIALNGSNDEKISAATILCGASLVRGWNIQEHTMLFIIKLLAPPIPADYSGSESHLINYAPLLNVLLVGISSVDCVQILSLLGLVPLLAGVLMPICEVFGSSVPKVSWTLPSGEEISSHAVFSNAFSLLVRLWRFHLPPLENVMGDKTPVGSQRGPEYLLLLRNSQLASFGTLPGDRIKRRRYSKILNISLDPIFIDSFPRLKLWYRHHLQCIASTFSGLHGTPVHQLVDALLNMMFRRINRGVQSLTSATSGSSSSSGPGAEEAYVRLQVPAWDILEATPFALDAALTACAHGRLSPRELATGLKDLADFLPASLATIVSYLSAEVTRGIWKPAFMNGSDWPSPAANLSNVEQQIKKILSATGVNVPSLPVGGNSPATLPLPLAALVSLTITYRLDKVSERFLVLVGPALNALASGCPWPCMPIIAALWAQKVKRWSDFLVFSASSTVFHHNGDAVVQLLRSCFTSTLGFSPSHISSNGGIGALLGHGFGSHFSGGISPVAPGILYLRVHRSVRDVLFMTENILSILMQSVKEIASSGLTRDTVEKLKKTKYGMRYGQVSLAAAMMRVKLAASLGASLVWISGGSNLVQSLIKETLPSWFISSHGPEQGGVGESGELVALLGGYTLAYFAVLCGTFAWGVDSASPASRRRAKVLGSHLEFLASALDGKISLGCDWATARAYISGFLSLMIACTPKWVVEINVDLLKRLSKGLKKRNEEELALALLALGGVGAMGAAAELIIEIGF